MEDHFLECLKETKTNPYFHQPSYGYQDVETFLTLLYPLITFSIVNGDVTILIQGIVSTISEYRYFMNFELLPRLTHFLDERESNYKDLNNILATCFQSYNKTIPPHSEPGDVKIMNMLYTCFKRDYPEEPLTLDMLLKENGFVTYWENLRKHNHYKDDERKIFGSFYQSSNRLPSELSEYLQMIQSPKKYIV